MTAPDRPRQVVVVGRDVPLWLAAATFGRALAPAGIAVAAVELPTRLGRADMAVTLPPMEALHARIGIDEERLLRATGGSFSLGHRFAAPDGASFFHTWSSHGSAIDGEPFIGHWLRARHFGLSAGFGDFSLGAVAAANGRLILPDEEGDAFGRADYGYHLPALGYAGYLKAAAQAARVTLHQARAIDAARAADGGIAALRLDGDRLVEGDLFIDATGPDALLAGGTPGGSTESWRDSFPADRRLIASAPALSAIPAHADARVGQRGWTALHPAAAATGVIHAYASEDGDDEAAWRDARVASGLALDNAVVERLSPGFREPWQANCVAVGGAACALDPVHAADLHLVQLGLVQLLALFPAGATADAERIEYNRIMRSHAERIRDFQAAFYLTGRDPGAFWDRGRAGVADPALSHRITTFAARGTIAPMEDDSFAPDSWQALLLGRGVIPAGWPPAVDATQPDRLKDELRRLLRFVADKVRAQPVHHDYLRRLTRSEAA